MMIRTQIQLTEQQVQNLKSLANARGVSMAELIREGVDSLLKAQQGIDLAERRRRAIAAAGMFQSDVSDLGVNHDRYLAEAYEQ
ncbi:MAG: CopG family transcriptional regulator [Roseiflexaceae bacterium]